MVRVYLCHKNVYLPVVNIFTPKHFSQFINLTFTVITLCVIIYSGGFLMEKDVTIMDSSLRHANPLNYKIVLKSIACSNRSLFRYGYI